MLWVWGQREAAHLVLDTNAHVGDTEPSPFLSVLSHHPWGCCLGSPIPTIWPFQVCPSSPPSAWGMGVGWAWEYYLERREGILTPQSFR